MKCKYVMVSESCVLDQLTGTFSSFNIIDLIVMASAPYLIPKVAVFSLFLSDPDDRSTEKCELQIEISNKVIFTQAQDITFQGNTKINRNVTLMHGLVVPEIGPLRFSIKIGSKVAASWEVEVQGLDIPHTVQNTQRATAAKPKRAAPRVKQRHT